MPTAHRRRSALVALSLVLAPLAATHAQLAAAPGTTYASAPAAAPAEPSSAVRGVFRVSLEKQSAMTVPATLIVERHEGRLAASLVVDQRISALQSVRLDGDVLEAVVSTEAGPSKLRVRIAGDRVDGTLTAKREVWTVLGVRSA